MLISFLSFLTTKLSKILVLTHNRKEYRQARRASGVENLNMG